MQNKKLLFVVFVAAAVIIVYSAINYLWTEGKTDAEKTKAASSIKK